MSRRSRPWRSLSISRSRGTSARPGRPSEFCADTDHNYSRAYDERRKLVRAAAKAEADSERSQARPQMT
ncbi:hypothetical protein, partial [Nocardia wallacei]|uniref:hypothetical protein n=1 Tax=Nocardia wallacei TaxID=480035 RepID=UPI002457A946